MIGSAALKVLAYLAPRHTEALQLLATLQLSSASNFVSYSTFKEECLRKMLTSADTMLKNMLKELSDHNLVGFDRDDAKNEIIFVPPGIPLHEILSFSLEDATR